MKKSLIALCLLLVLLLTGCGTQGDSVTPTQAPTDVPAPTQSSVPTDVPAATEPSPTATEPAQAYLVVTVAGAVYEPIPLQKPGRYTVRRGEHVNVIQVTEDSVCMAESSCDNQDCVYQGVVNLENRSGRVLQNMIICLPNEVMLELYTYEELQVALPGWLGGQE